MIFVITGPSGCGKSTLIKRVMAGLPGLAFSVSHTTRGPRPSETAGVNYHFVSEGTFRKMAAAGRFAEWAVVHGHYYGTSKVELKRGGRAKDMVLDIDVQGAGQIKENVKDAVFIFILPPVADELKKRLLLRGENTPEDIARRLKNAASEIKHYGRFDFVVINGDLEKAVDELRSVIVSVRCRTKNRKAEAARIAASFRTGGGKHEA